MPPMRAQGASGAHHQKVTSDWHFSMTLRISSLAWLFVRQFPYPKPPAPPLENQNAFIAWLARSLTGSLALSLFFELTWMVSQAMLPFFIGRALDEGVTTGNFPALVGWVGWIALVAVVATLTSLMRHRVGVSLWLQAAFKTSKVANDHVVGTGKAVNEEIATGDIIATSGNDAYRLAEVYYMLTSLVSAVLGWLFVSFLVWQTSATLGITVLIAVPVACLALAAVIKPLQKRQEAQREASGKMTSIGADTVAGLRVLRGIGGEDIFVDRYRERSELTRDRGIEVAATWANMSAIRVLVAGLISVLFTWLGALAALRGEITVGQLVSLYGYTLFLINPIMSLTQLLQQFLRGRVSAKKLQKLLRVSPLVDDSGRAGAPEDAAPLVDEATGARFEPGKLTAIVSEVPDESAKIAMRLGRFSDKDYAKAPVRWGGTDLRSIPLAALRERVVVSEASPSLFTGTLRSQLDPKGSHTDAEIMGAMRVASALDILDGLEGGLDHRVTERGRGFSGGQRQRLVLVRALLSDAENLVLVEPSSAVDAHTEARIAERLPGYRRSARGATVIVSASPLILGQVDEVAFVAGGRLIAQGPHAELMDTLEQYRKVVVRGE